MDRSLSTLWVDRLKLELWGGGLARGAQQQAAQQREEHLGAMAVGDQAGHRGQVRPRGRPSGGGGVAGRGVGEWGGSRGGGGGGGVREWAERHQRTLVEFRMER